MPYFVAVIFQFLPILFFTFILAVGMYAGLNNDKF